MKPIDLRELCGERYRIRRDPAALYEAGGTKDPWLLLIPCRDGHIFPHSDKLLALWWESATRLDRRCPALRLYQNGDDEKVYLFDPADFEVVAKVAHPKRRRRLSPAHKAALMKANKQSRFTAGS